jgi:gamma-glutamyltranspeptidase/glutathione hydrolase
MDEAIEAPRMHCSSSAEKARPIDVESHIPSITIKTLQFLGNEVKIRGDYDLYFGGAQGIMVKDGVMYGGGDSHRDGVFDRITTSVFLNNNRFTWEFI